MNILTPVSLNRPVNAQKTFHGRTTRISVYDILVTQLPIMLSADNATRSTVISPVILNIPIHE
jgi:hypothetical protein